MKKSGNKRSRSRRVYKKILSGTFLATPLISQISAQTVKANEEQGVAQVKEDAQAKKMI